MNSGFPDGVSAEGCMKKCEANEILQVNVGKYDWNCVPKAYK